jgi:hypothetical protein
MVYARDTSGTPDVITLAPTPVVTAYTTGMRIAFLLANTVDGGTVTLTLNALSAQDVLISGLTPPKGSLLSGQLYEARYDGTAFEVVSPPNSQYFEGSEIALVSSANGTIATGFAQAPKRVVGYLRCKIAESGYLVGDEVPFYLQFDPDAAHGILCWIRGTSVAYQMASSTFVLYDTSGHSQVITNANWKWFVRAWA